MAASKLHREMPVYEFGCQDCGERFDMLLPMAATEEAAALPACRVCGEPHVRRLPSRIAGLTGAATAGAPSGGAGCACGGACACGR